MSGTWERPPDEPLYLAVKKDDSDYASAASSARDSFPTFLKLIREDRFVATFATNAVKIRIKDTEESERLGKDCFVFIWIYGIEEEGAGFKAQVMEIAKGGISGIQEDDYVSFLSKEIYDWMIIQRGHVWGAYSLRITRSRQPEEMRAKFDEYSGISVYEDLP
jgi:uncharacterized protein YegJ (DUF2314 family)